MKIAKTPKLYEPYKISARQLKNLRNVYLLKLGRE